MSWNPTRLNSQILAIHAALVPGGTRGRVLYFGGDEHWSDQSTDPARFDRTRLFDVETGNITAISSPTTDVFCSGHAFLPDGRLLIGGGTAGWPNVVDPGIHGHGLNFSGHRASWVFHARSGAWRRVSDMNPEAGYEVENTGGGRWYPTLISLSNGEVLALFGHPHFSHHAHRNNMPERFSATANAWNRLPEFPGAAALPYDSGTFLNYPRLHLLPNGNVFVATSVNGHHVYDPMTGTLVGSAIPNTGSGLYDGSWDAASVMLPLLPADAYKARVLYVGDIDAKRIDLSAASPTWQNTVARTGPAAGKQRRFCCAVILPNGEVFVTGGINGGNSDANAVRDAELYRPGIDWAAGTYAGAEAWVAAGAAAITRNYHSTAILMPDGRVWTAGSSKNADSGDPNVVGEKTIEFFEPDYFASAARPDLTAAPPSVGYGQTFEIETPQAASIQRVALTRCGSVTHAFDGDQRYVGLNFTRVGATNVLRCTAPPSSGIAPAGNYLLWVVDSNGRPCKAARFVRVSAQQCFIVTDRSTFSQLEVEALLPPSAPGPAIFSRSLYVIFEGFLPHEISTIGPTPALSFTLDSPSGAAVPGLTATLNDVAYEDPTVPPDVAQRVAFAFDLRFTDATVFGSFTDRKTVNVRARLGAHICDATLELTKKPNPYMMDGNPHWLSIDVRVFQMRPGQSRAGVVHGSGGGAPNAFVQDLLTDFNARANDEFHPFRSIPVEQNSSPLELAREVDGQRVYNYAVAKVRYRAVSTPATNVRVFFRLFDTVGTALEYNTGTTYRRHESGGNALPLLGRQGSELISIPFFAAPRVTPGASMTTQTDAPNTRTLAPAGAQESAGYFGCWLDFNQTTPQFPLNPTTDGPFASSLKSIQELIRGHHQCLIAEVFFTDDPTPTNATPGSSDNLSQRNLAIVESANPGEPASRTVQTTLVVKPSTQLRRQANAPAAADDTPPFLAAVTTKRRIGPDELMLWWGNVPRSSKARLYLPGVNVRDIVALAAQRQGPPVMEAVDDHTLELPVGEVTFLPLPGDRPVNIPGLLSIELPDGVKAGQTFKMVAQQWSGVTWRVIGAFQLAIPVVHAPVILPREIRKLSVLKHIAAAIPQGDRWHPVFERYLKEIEDRVKAFGGNPDKVAPSPDGTGQPFHPDKPGGGPCDEKRIPCPSDLFCLNLPWDACEIEGEMTVRLNFRRKPDKHCE